MTTSLGYKCKSCIEELVQSTTTSSERSSEISLKISVIASFREHFEVHQSSPSAMDQSAIPSIRSSVSSIRNAARATIGILPSSGDTFLISQQSGYTEFTHDHGQSPQIPPSPTHSAEVLVANVASSQRRKRPTPREIVDEEHLCTLIVAYNVHFERYSVGKTNVTQVIPKHVWKETYATYLETHPNSVFRQESLKDRLRETLKELKIGNSNAENAEQAALQSNHVMVALRCTDGHAKRNVLRKRASILKSIASGIQGSSEGSGENDWVPLDTPPPGGKGPVVPGTPKKARRDENQKENMPFTKAQMLFKQSAAIKKISNTYQQSTTKRDALVDLKIVANEVKYTKHRIDNLKIARDLGVIDEGEFQASANESDGLWTILQDQLLEVAMSCWVLPADENEEASRENINWDELNNFMKDWRALLGPLAE